MHRHASRRPNQPTSASSNYVILNTSTVLDLDEQVEPNLRDYERTLDDSFFGNNPERQQKPVRQRKLGRQPPQRARRQQREQHPNVAHHTLDDRDFQLEESRQRNLAIQEKQKSENLVLQEQRRLEELARQEQQRLAEEQLDNLARQEEEYLEELVRRRKQLLDEETRQRRELREELLRQEKQKREEQARKEKQELDDLIMELGSAFGLEEAKHQMHNPRRRLLTAIPLVRYIPAPTDSTTCLAGPSDKHWEEKWVESSVPSIILEENRAGCLVCMMDFEEPTTKDELELLEEDDCEKVQLNPEPLRLLQCGHLFHKACLGRWILLESPTCPYCRKNVTHSA